MSGTDPGQGIPGPRHSDHVTGDAPDVPTAEATTSGPSSHHLELGAGLEHVPPGAEEYFNSVMAGTLEVRASPIVQVRQTAKAGTDTSKGRG